MTWEIVVGIIALVGLVATFVNATYKVSKTMSALNVTIQDLKEALEDFKISNKESHKVFYTKLDNHEHRICALENRSEYCRNKKD